MDFFEFAIAISVVVILPVAIIKLVLDYKREQLAAERSAQQSQGVLTLAELKQMVREVVQEANAPLVERIEILEQFDQAPFSGAAGEEDEAVPSRTIGRQTS